MAHHDCPGGCWVLGGDDGGCFSDNGARKTVDASEIWMSHQLRLVGFLPFIGSSHTSKRWCSRRISEPSTEITSQTSVHPWKSAPKGDSDLGNHHVQVPCVNCGGVYFWYYSNTPKYITGKIHPLVLFQASPTWLFVVKKQLGPLFGAVYFFMEALCFQHLPTIQPAGETDFLEAPNHPHSLVLKVFVGMIHMSYGWWKKSCTSW